MDQNMERMTSNVICETSPPLAGCVKSNTNAQVLGGLEQAKAAMFYLTSYLSKNPVKPEHWITCTSAARAASLNSTSTADDVHTNPLRSLVYFVQKVINRLHGNIEIADTQIASMLLGMQSYASSHDFRYCYVWPAVHYQIRQAIESNRDSDSSDSDSNEKTSKEQQSGEKTSKEQQSGETPEKDDLDRRGGFKELYEIPDPTSQDPEAKKKKVLVSQVDNYKWRCRDWNVPESAKNLKIRIGTKDYYWPSLEYVYGRLSTDHHVLTNAERNAERNYGLRFFNLLEYSRHVRIEEMPNNPENSDKTFYYFSLDHPLRFTHVQVLDPKHRVSILAGKVPKLPKEDGHGADRVSDRYGRGKSP